MAPRVVMRSSSAETTAVQHSIGGHRSAPSTAPNSTTAGTGTAASTGAGTGDGFNGAGTAAPGFTPSVDTGPAAAGTSGPEGGVALPARAMDAIVDALEERVLAEIERRGGRYQGRY
jgi:hypothetical protein